MKVGAAHHAAHHAALRAQAVARSGYGRLLALLAARTGDIAAAEDALADAFRLALETWPTRGVPDTPEAWLYTVARHRAANLRSSAGQRLSVPLDETDVLDTVASEVDPAAIPDERLKLMFVCAHPAIDTAMHAPFMLQSVLGLEAVAIARVFVVPASAMAQRLVRVKKKIGEARIPFAVPDRSDMPHRLASVLEAIYGALAIGFDVSPGITVADDSDLASEALFLARLLAQLLPAEPEALGLASLVAHVQARRATRRTALGDFVPLDQQDTARWDEALIQEAEALLHRARAGGPMGRFQLEAAIQSVHAHRRLSGATDWDALALLYEGLMRLAPSAGAAVGRAAAVGQTQGPAAGLAALDALAGEVISGFQPAWAVRAHLLARAGRIAESLQAYTQAAHLALDPAVRAHLLGAMEALRAKC